VAGILAAGIRTVRILPAVIRAVGIQTAHMPQVPRVAIHTAGILPVGNRSAGIVALGKWVAHIQAILLPRHWAGFLITALEGVPMRVGFLVLEAGMGIQLASQMDGPLDSLL
jgi:hypothetical protein